jgi:protocatechuate 3,4-dioxygenase beta subunit
LGLPELCTVSEASGAYSLQLTDTRPVTLSASARGYRVGHANAGRPIQREGTSRAQADIVLPDDGARLTGTVTDALGGAIADARVQLWRIAGALQSLVETRSDQDGKFELWTAPGSASIRVQAPGYAPVTRGVVAPSRGIALQLTPAATISGTAVERATGKPLAGVEVRAMLDGIRGRGAAAISGYDGQFALTGLEPGRYLISAEHEHFRAGSMLSVQLGLAQVAKSLIVPLVPAVSLHGKIVSNNGAACMGGRVTLEPSGVPQPEAASPSATVSSVEPDGSVRVRGLAPGRYRVDVRCADQVLADGPSQLDIQDHDAEATWRVEPGLGLDISVLDAANHPVSNAALILRRSHPHRHGATILSPLTADDQGRVSTGSYLQPGTYTVTPSAGLRGEPVTVELGARSGLTPVTVRVQGNAFIEVDVRDEHAQPVDGLQVSARAGVQVVPAQPKGTGAYRIGPLAAGRYAVHAADGVNQSWGDSAEHALVSVPSGATARATLQIERSASVSGSVVDAEGQPAANVWVSVHDETVERAALRRAALAQSAQRRLTDADGRFELDGLSKRGRFVISVNDAEAGEGSLHNVQPGAPVRLVLTQKAPIASSAGDR